MKQVKEQDDHFGQVPWLYGKQPHTTNNNWEWYFNAYFTHYMKKNGLPNCKMWRLRNIETNETCWICTEQKKHGGGYIVFESHGNAEAVVARIDVEKIARWGKEK